MTPPSDPLTRFIAVILTLVLMAVFFVFGLFFFLIILGGSVLLALAIWIRQKVMIRKQRHGDSSQVIDAEFQVIQKKDEDEEQK